jgi:thiosulfate dehydrogenase [quinone] large subunit
MAKKSLKDLSKHVAVLRIIFGLMWAIDASFKWLPAFRSGFLHGWFKMWTQLFAHNPTFFAMAVAVIETLIAIALIFGIGRRAAYLAAAIFSLLIWAIPGGFGGPYNVNSTDIGVGVIYAIVFLSLYGLDRMAGQSKLSLDNYIIKRLPWWAVVANP